MESNAKSGFKWKIFRTVGPLLMALLLLGLLFLSTLRITPGYTKQQLRAFAMDSTSRASFVGYSVKQQAMADKSFLPIMGSSELQHLDPYFPSVYAEKYQTSWTPFLVGQPGTQSLTHYFWLNSVAPEMQHRKIVFIISPQWFVNRGILAPMFENFTSKGEIDMWLESANPKDVATQTLAARLLGFKTFDNDNAIKSALLSLQKGKAIDALTLATIQFSARVWKHEDLLFSRFNSQLTDKKNPLTQLSALTKKLPEKSDFTALDSQAYDEAAAASTSNPYRVSDTIWNKSLKNRYKQMSGYQNKYSYLQSPEYADFQLLLNAFAKNHDDVQFIIQPVNNAWYSYTGLSMQMMADFSTKITEQLTSQGFKNIADYTYNYDEPYFVGDTDHLGYRGWVAVDETITNFMKAKSQTNYTLNNAKYLSKDWQQMKP
ncbi:MAG: D-alanyl-lipoteichoic acid biosynthesis protein DltD [Streptococcaceae bacterium]|jgi:D-alanine transfer protein|nr:D-alanyl-lipoteichoic acid biosynthesis protein DltD [Streptococcaceae bacterium]